MHSQYQGLHLWPGLDHDSGTEGLGTTTMGAVTSTKRLRVFWLLDTLRGRPLLVNSYLDQKSRKEQPLTSAAMAESLQKQHAGEQRHFCGAKEMFKVPHQMGESRLWQKFGGSEHIKS